MRNLLLLSLVTASLLGCGGDDDSSSTPDAAVPAPDAAPPAPTLTTIMASTGPVGTEVTLSGEGLGATAGTLSFGEQPAIITSWTATTIAATVPELFPGEVQVTASTAAGVSNALTFQVILPPAVYVDEGNSGGANTLVAMSYDPSANDVLTPMPSSPVTLGSPASGATGCYQTVALHEQTRRLFVAGSTTIDVFDIHPKSGIPYPGIGSPFTHSGESGYAFGLSVTHAGDRLYISYIDRIGVYDIDADGILTEVSGSPVAIDSLNFQITQLALHPNDGYLYALVWDLANGQSQLRALKVGAPGAELLTAVGAPQVTPDSKFIAIRPGQDQLVQTTTGYGMLVWNLDPSTGALAQLAGSPFAFTFPNSPLAQVWNALAFSPDGSRAFVGEYADERLYVMDLATDGTPTLLRDDTVFISQAETSSCLQVSRDAKTLLISDALSHFAIYSLAADGTPTDRPGSPWYNLTDSSQGFAATF